MGQIEKKKILRSLVSIKEAHKLFVRPGIDDASSEEAERQGKDPSDITDKFFMGLVLHIQVERGYVWKVFRNAGVFDKTLMPGPHFLWNTGMPWERWQVLRINTQSVRLKFRVDGRVRGPALPQETSGVADAELALNVGAEFIVWCKISNIEHYLDRKEPLDMLFDIMNDLANTILPEYFYDQSGKWAIRLAHELQQCLKEGSREHHLASSHELVGITVERITVNFFESNAVHDSNAVKMYELVEQNKREKEEASIQKVRDLIKAESYEQQGELLGVPASYLALPGENKGTLLIEKEAEILKAKIAAGMLSESTGKSLTEQARLLQQGSGQTRIEEAIDASQQFDPHFVPPEESNHKQTIPDLPLKSPLPPERKGRELEELKSIGLKCGRKGRDEPVVDARGTRSVEWVLQAYTPRDASFLGMEFHCPMGYPAVAPSVKVQLSPDGQWSWFDSEIVADWQHAYMLADIAEEIIKHRQD